MSRKEYLKKVSTLGLAGIMALGLTTLTGCLEDSSRTHGSINNTITSAISESEGVDKEISNFQFLCADVKQTPNELYDVDINGLVTYKQENETSKAYATLNYLVEGHYFDGLENASHNEIIKALSKIIEDEQFKSISIEKVANISALNNAMAKVTEAPLKEYGVNKNLLYAVGNLNFNDDQNVVSFSTKQATKFSKTTVSITMGFVGFDSDGNVQLGPVATSDTDYQTMFVDHNVYIKLTPEEMEAAKQDHSIVFSKFAEFVKGKQKDKYSVQQTDVRNEQEFSAVMLDRVSLERQ